jgi:hypothetical protein
MIVCYACIVLSFGRTQGKHVTLSRPHNNNDTMVIYHTLFDTSAVSVSFCATDLALDLLVVLAPVPII